MVNRICGRLTSNAVATSLLVVKLVAKLRVRAAVFAAPKPRLAHEDELRFVVTTEMASYSRTADTTHMDIPLYIQTVVSCKLM
jgi:hypothetical protein